MRKMSSRDKPRAAVLSDEATVTMRQAAVIFCMGEKRFRQKFDERYQFMIAQEMTTGGRRLSLFDCMKAAYRGSRTVAAI